MAGTRTVAAGEFFLGPLECAIEPIELAVSAYFPVPTGRTGTDISVLSRRHGDFALAGVRTLVNVDEEKRVENAKAPERHRTQYFEIAGNRAIYQDGWFARTIHRAPWEPTPRRPLQSDVWELYEVRADFSLATDVAAKNPKKLAELQAIFMKEAARYRVLRSDDRVFERLDPRLAGRPDLMAGRTSLTRAEGMTGMMEGVFVNVKNRSKTITAEVDVPASGGNGTVIAQGGRFGGWSLYVKDGVPGYTYNFLGQIGRASCRERV